MARAQSQDYLHSSMFHVDAVGPNGENRLLAAGRPQAGFSQVTTPELTTEAIEYKEGNSLYTKKQPGNPTVSDLTLSRGVTRGDSAFWDWCRIVVEGGAEYRADLEIKHFHRDTTKVRAQPAFGNQPNMTQLDMTKPAIIYHVKEAFPIRCKPGGDFDATSSEISLSEVDVAFEYFEVEQVPVT